MSQPGAGNAAEAPRTIALAGPTASGKTSAALAIAGRWPCEIISVDSALVYRGMNIGTAKPSPAELDAVPHHLIDIRDPLNAYSAAEFARDAKRLIAEIAGRGKIPLLVGGTMLYFKALFDGLDDMPGANPVVRQTIATEAAAKGWPAMHAELALVDAPAAARLQPNDSQRISRALEVYRVSGLPLSSFQHRSATNSIAKGAGFNWASALICLEPEDRSWLHARIAQRFDVMLAAGLMDEVKRLRGRGDLNADLPSMRCVGYRQAWEFLDAQDRSSLEEVKSTRTPGAELNQLRDKGIIATRQLAKRQITWLRSIPGRQIVACDKPDALDKVLALVEKITSAPA